MTLVQYIVVRKDLASKWSKGAIIAQACHGVTKCLVRFANDDQVKQYLTAENINQMHKIVLEAGNEEDLVKLSNSLKESGIDFVEWIEFPENIVTSIVLKPDQKDRPRACKGKNVLTSKLNEVEVFIFRKIFVGGLNNKTNEIALRLYFEKFGPVECVSLVYDTTGRSKGYGFVTFKDPESVEAVLRKIHVIDLRQVDIKEPIDNK